MLQIYALCPRDLCCLPQQPAGSLCPEALHQEPLRTGPASTLYLQKGLDPEVEASRVELVTVGERFSQGVFLECPRMPSNALGCCWESSGLWPWQGGGFSAAGHVSLGLRALDVGSLWTQAGLNGS